MKQHDETLSITIYTRIPLRQHAASGVGTGIGTGFGIDTNANDTAIYFFDAAAYF
jgi:hypothetical protein